MIKKLLLSLFLFTSLLASAQGTTEMADTMRSNGKIYVVVAVILTIFAGIILYLVRMDRKLTRLEKNMTVHHL
jgi:tRNA(Phe) wybutosine-synthesizing methylase Tyw3